MPLNQSHVTIYTCDQCGKEIEIESRTGLTPPWPSGWWGIQPSSADHDLFCSWRCMAGFCTRMADEADARAAARAATGAS